MEYRQYPFSLSGYTYQQCPIDWSTRGGYLYESASPCQGDFRLRPTYWYNPYLTEDTSFPMHPELNESRREIGTRFLGVVQNGRFRVLYPQPVSGFIKLTEDNINVGRPIVELKLDHYEGKVILLRGHFGGKWIYQVKIIEEAGPILTIITKQLFNVSDHDV